MQDFKGRVAVITGAASGIGRGLASHCAGLHMKLVLADINLENLEEFAAELSQGGTEVLAVPTDVTDEPAVEQLADQAYGQFGRVDLLFNNAGVLLSGHSWERSAADWRWVMDINFMGVLHGIRAFVPRMLKQDGDAHIVNTASLAALLAAPLMGPYTVSKQAVLGLSETLHYELQEMQARVGVSVVCPGQVASGIVNSGGHREYDASDEGAAATDALQEYLHSGVEAGMEPAHCAEIIFEAIRKRHFWIFTHPHFKDSWREQAERMLAEKNPVYDQLDFDLLDEEQ